MVRCRKYFRTGMYKKIRRMLIFVHSGTKRYRDVKKPVPGPILNFRIQIPQNFRTNSAVPYVPLLWYAAYHKSGTKLPLII